ncbi:hypothetical protein Hanom_Chr07g00624541 [Helianthus anomalus]
MPILTHYPNLPIPPILSLLVGGLQTVDFAETTKKTQTIAETASTVKRLVKSTQKENNASNHFNAIWKARNETI